MHKFPCYFYSGSFLYVLSGFWCLDLLLPVTIIVVCHSHYLLENHTLYSQRTHTTMPPRSYHFCGWVHSRGHKSHHNGAYIGCRGRRMVSGSVPRLIMVPQQISNHHQYIHKRIKLFKRETFCYSLPRCSNVAHTHQNCSEWNGYMEPRWFVWQNNLIHMISSDKTEFWGM